MRCSVVFDALERTRLAGRRGWLEPGRTALVPKHAVRFRLVDDLVPKVER